MNIPHGLIDQSLVNRKNDFLFRLSLKALIFDENGNVLVVKEAGRTWWDLPGGGMDFDESIEVALRRELEEEISLQGKFSYDIINIEEPAFLPHANVWQVRLVFVVTPENMTFSPGEDGDAITFIDPKKLQNSDRKAERNVYIHAVKHTA